MGGRGGASGLSTGSLRSKIPREDQFEIMRPRREELPELQGTEKQVKWAEKLREETLRDLYYHVIRYTSDGRPSTLYDIASRGTDAIIKQLKNEEKSMKNSYMRSGLIKEKINMSISSYEDLAKRISKFNEIAKNKSASFWIENRTNGPNNYMNKKFKKKVNG